jgi:serine protease Do
MSGRTIKLVAIIAVVAIVFSAFNTYLILDSIRVQEQLSAQEKKIDDLQASLAQLGIQNEQLAGLQDVIDAQEERLNELQTALDNLSVSGEQLNVQQQQLNTQQTQISELQSALDATRGDIEEVTSNLSNLTDQMSALDQSTSTSLAEFGTTLENIKGLISELTDLENMVNQLLDQTPQQVYEDAYRSVVVIRTPLGLGSGFLFGDSNIIVTNYHVVAEETDIEIEFFDRTRTQATVIGSDAYSDVAVLTVPNAPAGATPLVFSEQTDVHIGQQVVAIGNPLGLAESLSVGYISQVNRTLDIEPIIVPVLQLDLTIAPGSSGGPLLDLSGNVVGITNAGTDVGFNFAVPLNILRRVIPALITEGEYVHPFIGVYPLALTPEVVAALNILNVDAYQNGLLVMAVVPDFPAAEAGLNPAVSGDQGYTAVDIILAVDGYPMFLEDDLTAYMEFEVSPGQVITLTLWRSGVTSSVTLTTTERPPYQAS